ncbi:MAG: helix-turn-helix domain-containing protein [Sedimentisphaerales bacterium]|nr:helix-turn-helix domain-containing protein [Sedimentisphaerales bacterium]
MAKKTQNLFFEGIREGLLESIDSIEKGKKLTYREVSLPEVPHKMTGQEIADLREKKLNVSQHIFALLLNVSPKTVQAWEQNVNIPSGPALRLLWLIRNRPDIIKFILA